ncbi:DUF6668 family protein [Streptomyces sp. NPDC087844]|uniref:DUF6668 family protein n=1 Tax=Streptomyces sp. NPDC087844 TaxID=3365805 RepID=UPI003822762A
MSVSSVASGPQSWIRGPVTGQVPGAGHADGTHPVVDAPIGPVETKTAPASMEARPNSLGVTWVAAHGGSGATSLARALGGADVGIRWPDAARGEPNRILVVARTHAAGIQAASSVLNSLRTGSHPAQLELVAVVLVADAPGRLPLELARRVRVLSSAVRVHRVPWIPSWRVGGRTAHIPKEVLAIADLVGRHRPYPSR